MTEHQPRPTRVPFERPVWVGLTDIQSPLRRAWAGNLSRAGMFVRMRDPFPVGTLVLVALDGVQEILPLAEAHVVWQRPMPEDGVNPLPQGVGLAFRSLKQDVGMLLDSLMEGAGFQTGPQENSSGGVKNFTPVVFPTPSEDEDHRHASASLRMPHVGTVRLRSSANGLTLEFDQQKVQDVQRTANGLTLRFRST